jgi:hypothetical protein
VTGGRAASRGGGGSSKDISNKRTAEEKRKSADRRRSRQEHKDQSRGHCTVSPPGIQENHSAQAEPTISTVSREKRRGKFIPRA